MDSDKNEILKAFMANAAVPILYDSPNGVDQIGTGTLFAIDERLFLITAAHLFKDDDGQNRDPTRFAIPSVRTLSTHVWSLGPSKLLMPKDGEAFDIAVFELLEKATIERAKASWKVMTLANTGIASSSGLFVLCGFPSAKAKKSGEWIGGGRATVVTERMQSPPENAATPVHPALDLFFYYDPEGVDEAGTTIPTCDLKGCSGASVWEYREPDAMPFWTPEKCLTIVGVQCSSSRRHFRAKSWAAVLQIIQQRDIGVAA